MFRRNGGDAYRVMPTQLRGTYADFASLPASGNSSGDIAITTDDNKLYTWDATNLTWVLAGGSSGAGTVYKTNKLGSESDGGDLKTFSLTAGSWPSSNFLLVYKNGQSQREGATYDYTVTDSDTIVFTTTLASDDTVQMFVVSVDLYNPAWGSVNASIVPDTNNAYDIGSSSLQFKDVYVTGTVYAKNLNINGVLATSTATANAPVLGDSTGKIDYSWYSGTVQSFTAGEAIDASSAPLSVYLHTDGKVYKTSSAAASTTFSFAGFATAGQNKTTGQSINIQVVGNVTGFTGMATGSVYYVSTVGAISATAGTVNYQIGKALSPTILFIDKGRKVVSGLWNVYDGDDGTVTTTVYTGFRATKIMVYGCAAGGNNVSVQCSRIKDGDASKNTAHWVNGTTYGWGYTGSPAEDTTYLINFNATYVATLKVGTVNASYAELVLTRSTGTDTKSGINIYYIIEE